MQISYPASNKGVEMARIPRGAVASMLEKEATKNTIFFDEFTGCLPCLIAPMELYPDRVDAETVEGRGSSRLRENFARAHLAITSGLWAQKLPMNIPEFVSELSNSCKIRPMATAPLPARSSV